MTQGMTEMWAHKSQPSSTIEIGNFLRSWIIANRWRKNAWGLLYFICLIQTIRFSKSIGRSFYEISECSCKQCFCCSCHYISSLFQCCSFWGQELIRTSSQRPLLSPEISKAVTCRYVLCADMKKELFNRVVREHVVMLFTCFCKYKAETEFLSYLN
jgi:hypothetical protein